NATHEDAAAKCESVSAQLQPHHWRPGQSGNPGGLPRGTPKVSVALMKLLRTAPEERYEPGNKADLLAMRLFKSAMQGDTMAAREILDRIEGKPTQALQVTAQQLPTAEIVDRLVAAFAECGIEEQQTRRILLQLSAGDE